MEGAKIFELPVKVKDISTIEQSIYFNRSIGCAIAGSTLVAFNVYAFLQTAFSNLGGNRSKNTLPDCRSLCLKAEQALRLYVPAIRSPAEILLFGFCPQTNTPFIGKILTIHRNGEVAYTTDVKTDFSDDVEVDNIGDRKVEISEQVSLELEQDRDLKSIWHWRKPAKVLKEIIQNRQFESIGGNVQIDLCFLNRYDSYSLVVPTTENKATLKFRNIDYSEDIMGPVGDCIVAIKGYPIDRNP